MFADETYAEEQDRLIKGRVAQGTKGLASTQTYKVGVISFVPPYAYDDPVRGSDVRRLEILMAKAGLRVEIKGHSQPRIKRAFLDGKADIIALHGAAFLGCNATEPFTFWQDVLVVRQADLNIYKTPQDLSGRSVSSYEEFIRFVNRPSSKIDSVYKSFQYSTDRNTQAVYRRLETGQVDAAISDINLLQFYHLVTVPQKPFPFAVIAELPRDYHRLCVKDPALVPLINAAIKATPLDDGRSLGAE